MITVAQALHLVRQNATPSTRVETVFVDDALGRTLATDVHAPLALPPFRQSIMDGYALRRHAGPTYAVVGEIKTGDASDLVLAPGEAVRIFTGAQLPDSADAVVMQEHVRAAGRQIQLEKPVPPGQHIRRAGAQLAAGDLTLQAGETLHPAGIGLLKSMGYQTVEVTGQPRVSVIVTGNELTPPGTALEPGKIYESNGGVIRAALRQRGIEAAPVQLVRDSLAATETTIAAAFDRSDLVLISGGISVGDYDFVGTALRRLGVEQLFYKVRQKPGKPLYFGKRNNTYVFALPGNPASTLTCLYVYAFPLLDGMTGRSDGGLLRFQLPLAHDYENPFGRALFLKARVSGNRVDVLNLQNSAMVLSFARANALVYLPLGATRVRRGDLVETLLLPTV